jgi:tetratricopeptide (TPR) repeat protein
MPQNHGCDLLRRAAELHNAGQTAEAIRELQQYLDEVGEEGKTLEMLGTLLFADGDATGALSALEESSAMIPLSPRGQLVLAKCYDNARFPQAAAAIYLYLATLGNLDDELLEPLAAGLGKHCENQMALAVCRQAAQRMPDNPEPLMGIVHYMRRLRVPTERILPTLFRAHHLDPENKDCRITLAWLLHETGHSREGAHLLEQVDSERFTCIRCLTLMQHIFSAAGHDEQATDCGNRLKMLAGEWPGGEA